MYWYGVTPPEAEAVSTMAAPLDRGLERLPVNVTPVTGASARLTVICEDRALPAPSVATTVSTFAPMDRVTFRLQVAELLPLAVPPVAADPLTVTLVMPLPPAPLSVAVPANAMLEVVTV